MLATLMTKVKIVVSPEQQKALDATRAAYREACDYVSKYVFESHVLSRNAVQKVLYYTLRDKFGLKSQMAISVIRTVVARYKSIKSNNHKWTLVSFKRLQYDLVWNRDYSLTKNLFSVNTLSGRIKVQYYSGVTSKYFELGETKFGTAKLVSKHGKYYLFVPVTFEVPEVHDSDICNVVGIDRGLNFVVVYYGSNGKTHFVSGRKIKWIRNRFKRLRAELQQRNTPSARQRLRAINQRENRFMSDVNHCIARALVEAYPKGTLFVLEDLRGIRNATERFRRKDRYAAVSWSFYQLEEFIHYKAAIKGSKVIKVDPRYTSEKGIN